MKTQRNIPLAGEVVEKSASQNFIRFLKYLASVKEFLEKI